MGIRIHKKIGWGLQVSSHDLNLDRFINLLYGKESLSRQGFYNFLNAFEYPLKRMHEETPEGQLNDKEWTKKVLNLFEPSYDASYDEFISDDENAKLTILTPYSLSFEAFAGDLYSDMQQEGDEAFMYAEFERLFTNSNDSIYTTQSYTFKSPPFPDGYETVKNNNPSSLDDLVFPEKPSRMRHIKMELVSKLVDGTTSAFAPENLDDWMLTTPFVNLALIEYSGVLKNSARLFETVPRVVYYWT